jgi:hypothetical protein
MTHGTTLIDVGAKLERVWDLDVPFLAGGRNLAKRLKCDGGTAVLCCV